MARLGHAVLEVTGALRINYAMFGNVEPALHAHVFPRYATSPSIPQRESVGLRLVESAAVRRCARRRVLAAFRVRLLSGADFGPPIPGPEGRSSRTSSPSVASGAEQVIPRHR